MSIAEAFLTRLRSASVPAALCGLTVGGCLSTMDWEQCVDAAEGRNNAKVFCISGVGLSCPDPDSDEVLSRARGAVVPHCINEEAKVRSVPCGPGEFEDDPCCYVVKYRIKRRGSGCLVEGRPLRVEDSVRTARLIRGSSWGRSDRFSLQHTTDRAPEVVRHWLRAAQMEHASVASFAHVALELMAMGAPADLLDQANAAMRDEVRHTMGCLAIARGYGAKALEPGPLPLDGLTVSGSASKLLASTVIDGCVNETLAALQAAHLRGAAVDPEIAEFLGVVADDEARHAALAWEMVEWLISRDRGLAGALEDALARCRSEAGAMPDMPAGLEPHGVPSPALILEVQNRAWREVIEPTAATILAAARTDRTTWDRRPEAVC